MRGVPVFFRSVFIVSLLFILTGYRSTFCLTKKSHNVFSVWNEQQVIYPEQNVFSMARNLNETYAKKSCQLAQTYKTELEPIQIFLQNLFATQDIFLRAQVNLNQQAISNLSVLYYLMQYNIPEQTVSIEESITIWDVVDIRGVQLGSCKFIRRFARDSDFHFLHFGSDVT